MTQDEELVDLLNEEADIAADYLETFLDILDYEGDIEMGIRNNRAVVQIVADDNSDIRHLVGKNGEVVESLQLLTRLAVQQKTGDRSHVILDVDGYLKRQRQQIRDIALDAIDEVKASGEPVELEPMNSFERKIVHDIVREQGLRSRSYGVDPDRYIRVYIPRVVDEDDETDEDQDLAQDERIEDSYDVLESDRCRVDDDDDLAQEPLYEERDESRDLEDQDVDDVDEQENCASDEEAAVQK